MKNETNLGIEVNDETSLDQRLSLGKTAKTIGAVIGGMSFAQVPALMGYIMHQENPSDIFGPGVMGGLTVLVAYKMGKGLYENL